MKRLLFIAVFSTINLLFAQKKENLQSLIDMQKHEFFEITEKYHNVIRTEDTFIYKDKSDSKYSHYIKSKYDSLVQQKYANSLVLKNSIVKIPVENGEFYIAKFSNLKIGNYEFYRYKGNELLTEEKFISLNRIYERQDLKELLTYSFCDDGNCKYVYDVKKYSSINSEKELLDIKHVILIDRQGRIFEQFYDRDFPLDEKKILKILSLNFKTQVFNLMKGQIYQRDHSSAIKVFEEKDVEYENKIITAKIIDKEKAISGFYNSLPDLKSRAERAVSFGKAYDDFNIPYCKVIIDISMRSWEFTMDPRSGDIKDVKYYLLSE
ncbi:hypothetical protein [Chryseobacterium sp. Leaf394]|uniref:hypothetical protein n=1 Tax=Chryseobacterium sp. Leaf394 TaxID=1736361 RepID=UPI0006FA6D20|nr:hypothetical protein [Chryseobacterium sp. Leaf394]KQS93444.1 hypothetical protein ASG21_00280 [Chryseobacterium sp. Leaf394]